MNQDFTNPDFWKELRTELGMLGIGAYRCNSWSRKAIDHLNNPKELELISFDFAETFPEVSKLGSHTWIETKEERFIIDVTAGQIDANFVSGLYDFYSNIEGILRKVYTLQGSPVIIDRGGKIPPYKQYIWHRKS